MTPTQKITGMILMAAGLTLAQTPQQYNQSQPAPRMQEGAVCGQDAGGAPRILRRDAARDLNGRAQYQWTCLSDMERAPRPNPNPDADQQYQQYLQYQQMMPPSNSNIEPMQAAPGPYVPYNAPYNVNPQSMKAKVGKAFQVLQKAGQHADQVRQMYYTR